MYKVWLVNFHYFYKECDTLESAKTAAVKAGFECVIYKDSVPFLSFSPLRGWRGLI